MQHFHQFDGLYELSIEAIEHRIPGTTPKSNNTFYSASLWFLMSDLQLLVSQNSAGSVEKRIF